MQSAGKWMLLMMIAITHSLYADNGHREKLSPWLRQLASSQACPTFGTESMSRANAAAVSCMMVLVQSADGEASIRRAGGVPLCYAAPAWIVLVPANRLDALCQEPVVRTIDADGTQRVFDLSGRPLPSSNRIEPWCQKGIVIKNGRKVVR
jgi:hypothetical protein